MKLYCLGDSNTWGLDPRSPLGDRYPEPWCDCLGKLLGQEVFCDGMNGRTIRDVCRGYSLLKTRLDREKPGLLILLLGSNDLLLSDSPDPAAAAGSMEELLSMLRADFKNLPILLLSPPAIRIPGPWAEAVRNLGAHMEGLAGAYHTDFLNLSRCSLPLAWDGVHLTEEGHRLLAHILFSVLKKTEA